MIKKKGKDNSIITNQGKNVPARTTAPPAIWNLFDARGDVNRLFMNDPWPTPWLHEFGWSRPWAGRWLGPDMKEIPIDMIDTGNQYKIVAEIPGVAKEDIEVTVTPRNISICGKTETEEKEEEEGYIRQERSYSTLCRNMIFPEEVNPDGAEAALKDGILEVKVSKKTPGKGRERTIPVK